MVAWVRAKEIKGNSLNIWFSPSFIPRVVTFHDKGGSCEAARGKIDGSDGERIKHVCWFRWMRHACDGSSFSLSKLHERRTDCELLEKILRSSVKGIISFHDNWYYNLCVTITLMQCTYRYDPANFVIFTSIYFVFLQFSVKTLKVSSGNSLTNEL